MCILLLAIVLKQFIEMLQNYFRLLLAFEKIGQGSCGSWKTWDVMEIYNYIFQAWKVIILKCGSCMESHGKAIYLLGIKRQRDQKFKK